MNYIHEIKKENGDKVIIHLSFAEWKNNFRIDWIELLPKGKRNIQYLNFTDNYDYRALNTKGRDEYTVKKYLEVATMGEFKEAVMKAYESIKPVVESVEDLCKLV